MSPFFIDNFDIIFPPYNAGQGSIAIADPVLDKSLNILSLEGYFYIQRKFFNKTNYINILHLMVLLDMTIRNTFTI